MRRRQSRIGRIAVALGLLLAATAQAQGAQPAQPTKRAKHVTLHYSTGQLREPVYWSFTEAFMRTAKVRLKPSAATVDAMLASRATDGGELLFAFVQYVGDEGMRQKLKGLVPVAYLGEGFNLFGKDGQSTLGWWGLFAAPGTPEPIAAYFETAAAKALELKLFRDLMHNDFEKAFKTRPLPRPELQKPVTAASLRAVLDAPPRVPTPTGLEAARARAAALKAGPDYATQWRDRKPGPGLAILAAISGSAMTATAGNSLLAQALTPALQTYAFKDIPAADAATLTALNSFLTPILDIAQAGGASSGSPFAALLQPVQTVGAPPNPLAGVMRLLQANAPPPADASLVSLLQSIRAPGAPPMASVNPLTQALQSLSATPTGASQILETLKAAPGGSNSAFGQILAGLQQGGVAPGAGGAANPLAALLGGASPSAGSGGLSAFSGGGANAGAGTSAGATNAGGGAEAGASGGAAEVDRRVAGSTDPGVLRCAQQIKADFAQYERATAGINADQTITLIESWNWIADRIVKAIEASCMHSPSMKDWHDTAKKTYDNNKTSCEQMSSNGRCVDRLPAGR
jgi:hypothetical protein